VNKGTVLTADTNDSGNFTQAQLTPGTYRVAIEKSGFKRAVQENVTVTVGLTARVDATLTVGATTQEVTVRESPSGIEADRAACEHWLERSPALVTALAPKIGYAAAAKLAKEAVAKNVTVRQLVMEKGILKGKELDEVLNLRAMTDLGVPGERR